MSSPPRYLHLRHSPSPPRTGGPSLSDLRSSGLGHSRQQSGQTHNTVSTETFMRVPGGSGYATAPGTAHQLELAKHLMDFNNGRGQPYMSTVKPDRENTTGVGIFLRRIKDSLDNAGKNYAIRLGIKRANDGRAWGGTGNHTVGVFYDINKHQIHYDCSIAETPSNSTQSLLLKAFHRDGKPAPEIIKNPTVQETHEEMSRNNFDCNLIAVTNLQRRIDDRPLPTAEDLPSLRSKARKIVEAGYYDPAEHTL